MIERKVSKDINDSLFKGKAVLIYGARQTGKTTLVNQLLSRRTERIHRLNGDDPADRALVSDFSTAKLRSLTEGCEILFIDEAQKFNDIGNMIKLFTDVIKNVQVIATGSSSFELLGKTSESLTGRKFEFQIFPLSFTELTAHHGLLTEKRELEQRLIFGKIGRAHV